MKKLIIFLCVVVMGLTGCGEVPKMIQGQGEVQRQTYDLNNFTKLNIRNDFKVEVSLDGEFKVEVEAEENLFDYFEIGVSDGTLSARYKEGYYFEEPQVKMYVTMESMDEVQLHNDSEVLVQEPVKVNGDFHMTVKNDARFIADITAETLKGSIQNDGYVELRGVATEFSLDLENEAKAYLKDLKTEKGVITLSNDSYGEMTISEEVNVSASNDAKLSIYGHPTVNEKSIKNDAEVILKD